MLYTYTVPKGGNEFEVTISCNQDMDDYHLEDVTLNGGFFDVDELYIMQRKPMKNLPDIIREQPVPLSDYLLDEVYILLVEDRGVVYQDGLAATEYKMDLEREER